MWVLSKSSQICMLCCRYAGELQKKDKDTVLSCLPNCPVPNCPGATLSVFKPWCQIVHSIMLVPNCLFLALFAKLSVAKLSYDRTWTTWELRPPGTWAPGNLGHLGTWATGNSPQKFKLYPVFISIPISQAAAPGPRSNRRKKPPPATTSRC